MSKKQLELIMFIEEKILFKNPHYNVSLILNMGASYFKKPIYRYVNDSEEKTYEQAMSYLTKVFSL